MLLPPLYGQTYFLAEPVRGSASVSHFVGEIDMPPRMEALLEEAVPSRELAATVRAGESSTRPTMPGAACVPSPIRPTSDTRVWALHHEI